MSKMLDCIKGYVNRKILQEVSCAHCGKTGKIIFFSDLQDGNKLCSGCSKMIPSEFGFDDSESTLEDFEYLYNFMQYTKNELEPIFNPTSDYSYGLFKVDAEHKLCRIGDGFVFEISNISSYDFHFKAEEFKEGLFSSKVKGDVYLTFLTLNEPSASFDSTVIVYGDTGKAEKPLFSKTYIYQNPPLLDDFLRKFASLMNRVQKEKADADFQELVQKKAQELLEQKQKESEVP